MSWYQNTYIYRPILLQFRPQKPRTPSNPSIHLGTPSAAVWSNWTGGGVRGGHDEALGLLLGAGGAREGLLTAVEAQEDKAAAACCLEAVPVLQNTPTEDPLVPRNLLGHEPLAAMPRRARKRSSGELEPAGRGTLPLSSVAPASPTALISHRPMRRVRSRLDQGQ
jgi:hypothetical protein